MIFLPKASQSVVRHFALRFSRESGTEPHATMSRDNRQNVKWVEVRAAMPFGIRHSLTQQGVRGVASFLVVLTHLTRAFDYPLFWPRDTDDAAPRLLQLPFFRVPFQGRIGVMMFAFLTGYVCAIKPLRQIKSGNTSGALTTLAKSAFRRPPRLILPATFALVLSWTITQLNGFGIAKICDSDWLRNSSPKREGGLGHEIVRLFHEFQKSWIYGMPAYDEHQWALLPLLKGAFLIYATLFATAFMKFRMRVLTVFVLWAWYWCNPTPKTGKCRLRF